jgi:hypothetical protein
MHLVWRLLETPCRLKESNATAVPIEEPRADVHLELICTLGDGCDSASRVAARPKCCFVGDRAEVARVPQFDQDRGRHGRVLSISSTVCIGTIIDRSVD